jgi:hypothetical protein
MTGVKVVLTTLMIANMFINNCEASQGRCNVHKQPPQPKQNPNHFYLGPEIFQGHLCDSTHSVAYTKKVTLSSTYYGFRGGYEFIKPKTYYWNLEGACAWGNGHTKYSYKSRYFHSTVHNTFHTPTLFANAEFQGGYSFQANKRFLMTPFLGVGVYHTSASGQVHMDLTWVYASGGMRTVYLFNRLFGLGLNLKGMRAMYVNHGSVKDFWGYEIDLPFNWHFAGNRQWNAEFLPYFAMLNTHANDYIFGGRLLIGYRF